MHWKLSYRTKQISTTATYAWTPTRWLTRTSRQSFPATSLQRRTASLIIFSRSRRLVWCFADINISWIEDFTWRRKLFDWRIKGEGTCALVAKASSLLYRVGQASLSLFDMASVRALSPRYKLITAYHEINVWVKKHESVCGDHYLDYFSAEFPSWHCQNEVSEENSSNKILLFLRKQGDNRVTKVITHNSP